MVSIRYRKFKTKQEHIDALKDRIAYLEKEIEHYRTEIGAGHEAEATLNAIRNRTWPLVESQGRALTLVVEALIRNHESYLNLIGGRRRSAARKLKEADDLKAALRFIGDTTSNSNGSTYIGGGTLSISIDQMMRGACRKLDSMVAEERGCVQGNQDSLMADAVAELVVQTKGT